jgi:hypothetical protein
MSLHWRSIRRVPPEKVSRGGAGSRCGTSALDLHPVWPRSHETLRSEGGHSVCGGVQGADQRSDRSIEHADCRIRHVARALASSEGTGRTESSVWGVACHAEGRQWLPARRDCSSIIFTLTRLGPDCGSRPRPASRARRRARRPFERDGSASHPKAPADPAILAKEGLQWIIPSNGG